jgi:hypothetical protein
MRAEFGGSIERGRDERKDGQGGEGLLLEREDVLLCASQWAYAAFESHEI